jgi:hypothetical protein
MYTVPRHKAVKFEWKTPILNIFQNCDVPGSSDNKTTRFDILHA